MAGKLPFQSTASKLLTVPVSSTRRTSLLPLRTGVQQPAGVSARLSASSLLDKFKFKGSREQDHTTHRVKEHGDTTDPTTDAAASVMKDREESEGFADSSKPQGATQREGSKFGKKAKEEHPNAPEPIIGMNDEKGAKGH